MGGDGKREILDFKSSPPPTDSPTFLEAYERQICTYAHIKAKEFSLKTPPEAGSCKECKLRMLCHAKGVTARSD